MLAQMLEAEGFSVARAVNGIEGLSKVRNGNFDLVVLDVMMPGLSGVEFLAQLRRESSKPVLMLTAKGGELDRVLGLEMGADDYLPKPFHPRELTARIRAILRRSNSIPLRPKEVITLGVLSIEPAQLGVTVSGDPVRLTVAEFLVLEALVRAAGQMISRAALTEQALGRPLEEYDRSISTHVSNLRQKLRLGRDLGIEIRSIRNMGYMLVANDKR